MAGPDPQIRGGGGGGGGGAQRWGGGGRGGRGLSSPSDKGGPVWSKNKEGPPPLIHHCFFLKLASIIMFTIQAYFRRICMESSEHNISTDKLIFSTWSFFMFFFLAMLTNPIIIQGNYAVRFLRHKYHRNILLFCFRQ